MRDFHLRFDDETEWLALGVEREPGILEIDVVGVIYPRTIEPGEEPEPLPGWHVNIRCMDDRDLSELDPFTVTPTHPRRVWA